MIRVYMCNIRSHMFLEYTCCSYEKLQMTTGSSQGISLVVEGGCEVGVSSTFLRQTQASPWRIYSTSLLFSPSEPLLHENKTTAFMTRLGRNRSSFLKWWGCVIYPWMLSDKCQVLSLPLRLLLGNLTWLYLWILRPNPTKEKVLCITIRFKSSAWKRYKGRRRWALRENKLISTHTNNLWSLCPWPGLRRAY